MSEMIVHMGFNGSFIVGDDYLYLSTSLVCLDVMTCVSLSFGFI